MSEVVSLSDLGVGPNTSETKRVDNDDNTFATDFTDSSIKNYDFDLYKGRKNQTDRLAILRPESIAGGRVHFKEGAGYFICHSKFVQANGVETCTQQAKCCEKLGDPSKRFSAMVLVYNTRQDGELINPLGFSLKVWRFTADKFVLLRGVNKSFPLNKHDITVMCQEEQYQRLTIQPIQEAQSLISKEKFWTIYGPTLNPWITSTLPKMAKSVGRKLTEPEMLEKLGLAVAPAVEGSTLPVADIADLIG